MKKETKLLEREYIICIVTFPRRNSKEFVILKAGVLLIKKSSLHLTLNEWLEQLIISL